MTELIELWTKTLGDPPPPAQFVVWTESHEAEIVRRAILKTAQKNLSLGGTMSQDHRVRYASKVMLTTVALNFEHAKNRETLNREMEAR